MLMIFRKIKHYLLVSFLLFLFLLEVSVMTDSWTTTLGADVTEALSAGAALASCSLDSPASNPSFWLLSVSMVNIIMILNL